MTRGENNKPLVKLMEREKRQRLIKLEKEKVPLKHSGSLKIF
jgi:hypothetical protein